MKLLTEEQIRQYFSRINYNGPQEVSERVLRELIWKHVTTIPFDSLSIHIGEKVFVHDIDIIFNKLVENKRGGWCYEMNGLFFYVLYSLGFDVRLQLASVFENRWLPASHAILIVNVDEKLFLVDVGFGNMGLVEPLELAPSSASKMMKNGISYQIIETTQDEYEYNAGFNGRLSPQYRFKLSQQSLSLNDFIKHNQFIATHEDSPFTQHLVIKMATPHGFIKLIDNQYSEYTNKDLKMEITERHIIASKDDFVLLLNDKFGIQLVHDVTFTSPLGYPQPIVQFEETRLSCSP